MQKINILFLISTFRNSGPIRIVLNIIKSINKEAFQPYILSLSNESNHSLKYAFEELNIEIFSLSLSRIKGVFFNDKNLNKILDIYNIDIIHSHGLRPDILGAKFRNKYSWISTLHCMPDIDYKLKFGRLRGIIYAWKHMTLVRKMQKNFIACSETISKEILNKNEIELFYINNGVDISLFKKKSTDKKFDDGKIIFISIGSLIPRKNTTIIIKAFIEFNKFVSNSELHILGDGSERRFLENLSKDNRNIKFFGNVKDILPYLNRSNIFISASFSEGLPNSVLEAMACEKICLLSDIAPHRLIYESINSNEELISNLLFNPENHCDLYKKMVELSSEHNKIIIQDRMGYLHNNIVENFSIPVMTEKYEDLYLKLYEERIHKK